MNHFSMATRLQTKHLTTMLQLAGSTSCLKLDCIQIPLPVYSPSGPSPNYSCEPGCNEQRLQHTPRFNLPIPTGTFTKKSGKVTVTLLEQEDGAEIPTYGRYGLISGAVYLEKCEMVTRVSLKVGSIYAVFYASVFLRSSVRLRANSNLQYLKGVRNPFESLTIHIRCGTGARRPCRLAQNTSHSLLFFLRLTTMREQIAPSPLPTFRTAAELPASSSKVNILSMSL